MLIETVSIQTHKDIERLIDRVSGVHGVEAALAAGFGRSDAAALWIVLSEVAQNVVEHADAPGRVRLELDHTGCRVDVTDEGVGFAGSLGVGDHAEALSLGFLHGRSRFDDPGRGHGLKQTRKRVARWNGRIEVRSGSAGVEERSAQGTSNHQVRPGLEPLTGTQIRLLIPARSASTPRAG